jgi:tRNA threonylcarbamoyladenosine biosynthesis protein TsaE
MTETIKIELYVENLGETQAIATQLAHIVPAGTIILLEGDLGSGKTTFMQSFGKALGIQTTIASPTFTLIDEYMEGRLPLYHIDLYRLEPPQVPSLHLEEYWRGEDFPLGVVAIEWASKLPTVPAEHLKINLSVPRPERSPLSSQNLNLDPDTGSGEFAESEEFVEDLPCDRQIQLIAQGSTYIDLLKQFQNKAAILFV